MRPTKKKLRIESGRVFLCDMRPGFTDEGVECSLAHGDYEFIVQDYDFGRVQFTLVLTDQSPTFEQLAGTFSTDMARVGILDRDLFLKHFQDSEELFEWSACETKKHFQHGGFLKHKQSGLEALFVLMGKDCTCTVTQLFAGKRPVGVRVIPDLPAGSFRDAVERPYSMPGKPVNQECVTIDLREDLKLVRKFIEQRIKAYPIYENYGPGNDDDPITTIHIGFDLDEESWVSLVFGTEVKPAETELGHWTAYVDGEFSTIEFPVWSEALLALRRGEIINVLNTNFDCLTKRNFVPCVARMLQDLVVDLRKDNVFQKLPLAASTTIRISNFEGTYRWPSTLFKIKSELKLSQIKSRGKK